MKPWKIVGPLVLVVVSLLPAPADAQRRRGNPGGGGSRAVPVRGVGSRVVVGAPFRSFSRPYYTFRPRVSVGFGLYVGYPVAFPYYGYYGGYYGGPYRYGYPYPYPSYYSPYPAYSYSYPYAYSGSGYPYPDYRPSASPSSTYPSNPAPPAQGSIGVAPGSPQRSSGGISFEITPGNAQVYVEGQYVGLVSNFSPTAQPLTLPPGRHQVEIRLVGYQTMSFDAEVVAGQVVPYQGTLQR
jgi:hypothetical protein